MTTYKVKSPKAKLYLEWFRTQKAYHEMKIAKHNYKIAKANRKLGQRLGLEP